MSTMEDSPILAAYDFSSDGRAAVTYAAEHAARLRRPLGIVHVVPLATPTGPTVGSGTALRRNLVQARIRMRECTADVVRRHPGLRVTSSVFVGDPANSLISRTANAFEMVIGARGLGDRPGLRWGTASDRIVARAGCPLLIVRDDPHRDLVESLDAPIVVGMDNPERGAAAQAYADSATDATKPHYVLTVHRHPGSMAGDLAAGGVPSARLTIQCVAPARHLADALATVVADYGAGLVVVTRDRHRWPFQLTAGALIRDLVKNVQCPIAVVPTFVRRTARSRSDHSLARTMAPATSHS